MNETEQGSRGYEFLAGVVTGAFVGVSLAMWLAPKSGAEMRARAVSSVRDLGGRATEHLDQVSAVVTEVSDEVLKRGRRVRDEVADAVVSGASEVTRVAEAVRSDGRTPWRAT